MRPALVCRLFIVLGFHVNCVITNHTQIARKYLLVGAFEDAFHFLISIMTTITVVRRITMYFFYEETSMLDGIYIVIPILDGHFVNREIRGKYLCYLLP